MKKSVGVLVATAVLALSSACGGSGSDSSAPAAGDAKQAAATASAVPSSDASPLTRENFVDRLGQAQVEAGSAHLEMTASASGMDVSMTGDLRVAEDVEKSASRLSMDLGMMQMDVRLVDGVMYLKMGQMTGGKYVRIDLRDPDDPVVKRFGSSMDQVDPAKQLETFEKALVEFENEGDGGEIDGVPTTKVRLVVDTEKMLGSAETRQLGAKMPKQIAYVLYVGAQDDLMRRLDVDLDAGSTMIDWSRWGEDVDVEAPKKSEVTDAPALGFPTAGSSLDG